ncbi:MAG: DUF4162 domain-containing protein, partial [Bacteroidales bacterium]|nr:DUF4162 domain-containing protein [Bacteroidales bacterium]
IIEKGALIVSGDLSEIKQAALQQRTLRISLLSNTEEAELFLKGYQGIGEIHKINHTLETPFLGTDEEKAILLTDMINAGIKVTAFSETTSDLEQVFLQLTKGEVA